MSTGRTRANRAAVAAATLLGSTAEYATVPYVWSEQPGVRLNAYGHVARATDAEVIAGAFAERRFAAVFHAGDGPVAGLTRNLPKEGAAVRQRVHDGCAARRETARQYAARKYAAQRDPALRQETVA